MMKTLLAFLLLVAGCSNEPKLDMETSTVGHITIKPVVLHALQSGRYLEMAVADQKPVGEELPGVGVLLRIADVEQGHGFIGKDIGLLIITEHLRQVCIDEPKLHWEGEAFWEKKGRMLKMTFGATCVGASFKQTFAGNLSASIEGD